MAIPTWVPGQVLSASDVNTWFVPQVAVKTSALAITGSTTLVNDPHLVLPVAASASYIMDLFVWFDGPGGTTADLKASFTTPASATWNFQILGVSPTADLEPSSFQPGSTPFVLATTGTGTSRGATIKGLIITSVTAGSIQWQFAQNTSNATAVTVHSNSYMTLWRVG